MCKKIYLLFFLIVVCLIPWSSGGAVTQQQFTLTVQKAGAGNGTVTSSPAGLKCGTDCTGTFRQGEKVTLKAKADSGSSFAGWAGGGCTGIDPCSLVLDSDETVTATFDLKAPEISLSADELNFDVPAPGKKTTQTLVISNIGTGNLIVTVSGLEGTDFSISGKSTFVIKPNKNYKLKVTYAPSVSDTLPADTREADESMSGSGESETEMEVSPLSEKLQEAAPSGPNGNPKLILTTNDPKNSELEIELSPRLRGVHKVRVNIKGTVTAIPPICYPNDQPILVAEEGSVELTFVDNQASGTSVALSEKGYTKAAGSGTCLPGCTVTFFQDQIEYTIGGSVKNKILTIDWHITDVLKQGKMINKCPPLPDQEFDWNFYAPYSKVAETTMDFSNGASKTVEKSVNRTLEFSLIFID
jgi:hypothetical protein